ncbi:CBS domain protein [compost metagenome]
MLSIAPQASAGEALAQLHEHKLSAMPVLGARRELHGMLYLHDLLPVQQAGATEVSGLMQRDVPTCRPDWPITYLVQVLADSHVHKVPVLDEHKVLLGIVTQSDLVAALFRVSLESYSASPARPG